MGNIVTNINSIMAFKHSEEIPIPSPKTLTENQVKLIRKSWEIAFAKPIDFGERILYTYLERYPHNQQRFAAFRNTPLIMLKGTPGFRSHANKIIGILSVAIDCLGKEGGSDEIVKLFDEMAKNHRRRGIPKKAFVEIRVIIVEILSERCKLDDEGKQAWQDLIDTLYHILFTVLDDKRLQG